jgi:uncharacterized membrane protein YeaQ/YmgE (transglycosylase-associated protein family)
MYIIGWIVAGLIVGAIARLLVPGRQPMGIIMTIVLGIVGALVGGGISYLIWGDPGEPFAAHAWPGYLLSILGAVLVLWVYLYSTRGRTP